MTSIAFDVFGGFLAVGTQSSMTISSYKNWKKTLVALRPFETAVNAINFDASGRKIFVASNEHGEIKTLSLA